MSFLVFFQKTNKKIQPNYGTSSRIVFVRFLEELKTPKEHFEINWPLVTINGPILTSILDGLIQGFGIIRIF